MTRLDRDRPDSLSVPEMLRIMDVATAIRQDRELVEEQLNVEELKERLKERMIAASKVTGESVTPEEVDAAIRQYYASLYTFHEPRPSPAVALAHLWVRRKEILGKVGVLMLASGLVWWAFFSTNAPMSASGRSHRQIERSVAEIARRVDVVKALSRDPKVVPEVALLSSEADAYRKKGDATGLAKVREVLERIETTLGEEYVVTAVSVQGKNTVVRYPPGQKGKKVSGYYLFVQARKADGTPITRRIHDDEDDTFKDVTTWAERIPEAVNDRLKQDKLDDGILNETVFARKRRGFLDEEITLPGPDGKPISHLGRITKW